jgi:hypothetical protein
MINGAHMVLYSRDAEADRTFLQRVIGFSSVDAGGGWLIFTLPPSELAVHPSEASSGDLLLMCDNLSTEIGRLADLGVRCAPVEEARWGSVTRIPLPSGGSVGLYQPSHARPPVWIGEDTSNT